MKKFGKSLENFKKPLDKFRQGCYNDANEFGKPNSIDILRKEGRV
jgi:hypothetical protein